VSLAIRIEQEMSDRDSAGAREKPLETVQLPTTKSYTQLEVGC